MMDGDFITMGGYQDASQQPQAIDPNIDAAVRTAYAEAGKGGYGAVAGVIRNRAVKSGKTFSEVVAEPNAFEGYDNAQYKGLKSGSPQYQAVLSEVRPVLQGQADNPVGSADAYYSPAGQKAKGRQAPSWAQGKQPVANVGGNVFFNGVYNPQAQADLMEKGGYNSGASAPVQTAPMPQGGPVAASAASPSVVAQPQPIQQNDNFQGYDQNGRPVWSQPGVEATDPDLPQAPKGYYWPAGTEVGADGKPRIRVSDGYDPNLRETFDPQKIADELALERLQMTPSGQEALASAANAPDPNHPGDSGVIGHAANGALLGFLPQINGAIGYAQQGGENLINRLTGQPISVRARDAADAEKVGTRYLLGEEQALHPIAAPLAETGAALATSIPLTEAGVGALRAIPTAARAAGAGEGLVNALTTGTRLATGQADIGQGVIPALVRGGSQLSSGAIQGALGGALTTNLTNRSLGDNMLTGAFTGGTIGGAGSLTYDALKGGAGLVRSIAEPLSEQGRQEIVARTLRKFAGDSIGQPDLTAYVDGVKPTLAQAYNNRGLASLETAFQSGDPSAENAFAARARANNAAREAYVGALQGNKSDLEALQAARDADAGATLRTAFENAQPADPAHAVSVIDQALAGPEGQTAEARAALTAARKRIVGTGEGLSPNQSQDFERAMLKSIGSTDEAKLDNVTMANAKARIGQGLDDVASRTQVNLNDDAMNRLGQIAKEWTDAGYEAKPLTSLIEKIGQDRDAGGNINGDIYQTLTQKGGAFDKLAGFGSGYQKAAGEMRDVLDQALEDSSSPQDLAAVRQLRSQYRNMKMVEQAMLKSPLGDTVTPQSLLSSIKGNTSNFVYKGGDDLGDAAALAYRQAQPRAQLESDPSKLFGIRDDLDKVARGGGPGAASAGQARDALDQVLERSAPGYQDFLTKDAQYAQQIGEKRFLQQQRLDNGKGNITEAKVRNLVNTIETGSLKPGEQPVSMLSPQTVGGINNLLSDVSREESALPNGRLGSNTVNKLASRGIMAKMGIPMAIAEFVGSHMHMPGAGTMLGTAAGVGAKAVYNAKDQLVREGLQNALLNPEVGIPLLSAPPSVNLNQIPFVLPAVRQLPGAGAVGRNLLLTTPNGRMVNATP